MKISRLAWLLAVCPAFAADELNVVYGMYSGMALLLDVHRPATPNGIGVLYISGSGWTAPLAYSAAEIKSNKQSMQYTAPLVAAGYTVFSVNHRAAPRFRYPAAVEDVQRAVRFVRANAVRFGIRANRIGVAGGSSGGHLVSMLGTLDGKGNPGDADPVERESAKVQCVVARAAPVNFFTMPRGGLVFAGMALPAGTPAEVMNSEEGRTYKQASPISHVSSDDPPFLLIHGDKDLSVPYEQSEEMEKALKAAGVPVKLIRVVGAGHGPDFPGAVNPPDYLGAMVAWFDQYLRRK